MLLPWSRQARGEHSRGHVQRKPSYTIMRGARSETYFTRLASLFNVAAGLKWSRGTVPHNEAFWSSFWVVWAEGAPSNSRLQRLARGRRTCAGYEDT